MAQTFASRARCESDTSRHGIGGGDGGGASTHKSSLQKKRCGVLVRNPKCQSHGKVVGALSVLNMWSSSAINKWYIARLRHAKEGVCALEDVAGKEAVSVSAGWRRASRCRRDGCLGGGAQCC